MGTANKKLKGTQTEKNLVNAYVSESTAVTRYTFYSGQAEKENYFQYANIFNETAQNELRHAKIFFKYLQGGAVDCNISVDAGQILDTASNLETAAREEHAEGVEQYKESAKVAKEEGFDDIARHFEEIAEIEAHHEKRFKKMLKRINDGTVWKRSKPIKWQCLVCGYIYEGTEPPKVCPACDHPFQHYMPAEDNY